ncbi:MAG: hypothetical protein WD069_13910 [Planctomycetales bacterium]
MKMISLPAPLPVHRVRAADFEVGIPPNQPDAHVLMFRYFVTGDSVIPAKAGIQCVRRPRRCWMPAFAGMTRKGGESTPTAPSPANSPTLVETAQHQNAPARERRRLGRMFPKTRPPGRFSRACAAG